jgi:hypothetical protein
MEILINHLTRMRPDFICTAGIDLATGRHVRPIVQGLQLGTDALRRNGGPFDIGAVVDLGLCWHIGRPPEVEDHLIMLRQAKVSRVATPAEFWKWLATLGKLELRQIFGPDLTSYGPRSCGVGLGKGQSSLGCLRPWRCANLHPRPRPGKTPQVRIDVHDGVFHLDLAVTDIRLYGPDHVTPDDTAIRRVGQRLRSNEEVILCVGLTRPLHPTPGSRLPPLHWLQVTNLHFRDDPIWQLG